MTIYTAGNPKKSLSPSEAVFGFASWLTVRDEPVTMSAYHNAGVVAELVDQFCKRHDFKEPRNEWTDYLVPE